MEPAAPARVTNPRILGLIRSGVEHLKTGSQLVLASVGLGFLGMLALGIALREAARAPGGPGHWPLARHPPPGDLGTLGVLGAILAILSAVIGIAGFVRLLSSARFFAQVNPRYERGVGAARLIYLSLGGLLVGIPALLGGILSGSGGLAVLGGIVTLLSAIGLLVGVILFSLYISSLADLSLPGFRMPESYRTAGTLLLLGVILNVVLAVIPVANAIGFLLELIAFAMIYTTSSEVLEDLSRASRYAPTPLT